MPTQILLPDERAEQLKRFAESQGVTIADAVGLLIRDAIEAGKIPDELPGFKVTRRGNSVKIETGAWSRTLTRDLAKSYADQIRAVTRPVLTPGKGNPFMPIPDLGVTRRGVGVKLVDQKSGTEKTIAPGVADDVARLIDRAAK